MASLTASRRLSFSSSIISTMLYLLSAGFTSCPSSLDIFKTVCEMIKGIASRRNEQDQVEVRGRRRSQWYRNDVKEEA